MSGRSQAQCRTPDCSGVLGFWVAGEFLPAAHIIGARDFYIRKSGQIHIRCSRCNTWHLIETDETRSQLVLSTAR